MTSRMRYGQYLRSLFIDPPWERRAYQVSGQNRPQPCSLVPCAPYKDALAGISDFRKLQRIAPCLTFALRRRDGLRPEGVMVRFEDGLLFEQPSKCPGRKREER